MVEHVSIQYNKEAIVKKISKYFAYVQLVDGDGDRAYDSIFIKNILFPSDGPAVTDLTVEKSRLVVGQKVRVNYGMIKGREVLLSMVMDGAKPPTLIQVQDMAKSLQDDKSYFYKRLVKTISAGSAVTPDNMKSAKALPSPFDMSHVIIDKEETSEQSGPGSDQLESDASR